MKRRDFYQYALVTFAILLALGIGAFVYKELFPEYKTYQNLYKSLEKFRTSYTHEKEPPFTTGIKQIMIPNETGGPELIDRCISCHVAVDLPHFSPTRIERDVNGKPVIDANGNPVLEQNPDYIWLKLDERIAELSHPSIIEQFRADGKDKQAFIRLAEAQKLEALKKIQIEGHEVDVEKVLRMHPLIGSEMRPFEYHPIEEYGCSSCHSGNGRALVAKRAHGPVFDGAYEPAFRGPKPLFTEIDTDNDPLFAKMYNDKPGHDLVFQTTPLLAGPLVEAKCIECHLPATQEASSVVNKFSIFTAQKKKQVEAMQQSIENSRMAYSSLLRLRDLVENKGRDGTLDWLSKRLQDFTLTSSEIDATESQYAYVKEHEEIAFAIQQDIEKLQSAHGALLQAYESDKHTVSAVENRAKPLTLALQDQELIRKMNTNVDYLIANYQRGKELYISQACYACHRIAGFSRSSVGPELTKAGLSYPWYIKESIVWPQADLPSSTMPNFHLDHEELADLMTFLIAQKGDSKAVSEMDYQIHLSEWEKGEKMPWEEPVSPTEIQNIRSGQLVFATEGCASCHKLEGFESNVGLKHTSGANEWFYQLFPEQIPGSKLAKRVEENAQAIVEYIDPNLRSHGIIEEIERLYPGLIEGFYTNFKFAARAYDTLYKNDPEKLAAYKKKLRQVLMVYIQEYGLGRDIAPHLNWSGVWRDNQWLMGHFHNPTAYTAKSLMPVMPFDDTKFYMLNTMLHALGKKNRDKLWDMWRAEGFNPPLAFELLCSTCHGKQRQGNGIVAEWIFPIPKNLRNPIFLRSLTKERAIYSITHGIPGTPMPPWGEAIPASELGDNYPVLTHSEIVQLVDWLYQGVPYPSVPQSKQVEYEKWTYSPSTIVQEMEKEKALLQPAPHQNESLAELVQAYFEERPNPFPSPDKELYYIRDKYYTPENLKQAQEFFMVNCAICHGKDGTGTGLRATSMIEAKPRVFTGIPWIREQDDLFLMRAIKYGVPGTSMVPWGDQTTAKQRMQLAIFIRSLSRNALYHDELQNALYDSFDEAILAIESARLSEYKNLEMLDSELQKSRTALYALTEDLTASEQQAASIYGKVYNLENQYKKAYEIDQGYKRLIALIKEEKTLYSSVGQQIIAADLPRPMVEDYIKIVKLQPFAYRFDEGKLYQKNKQTRSETLVLSLSHALSEKISTYQQQIDSEKSKMLYPEKNINLQTLMDEQGTYINLQTKLLVELANAHQNRIQQETLFKRLPNAADRSSL